jgi:hypothetical protein
MGLLDSLVAGVKGVGGAIRQRVERLEEDGVLRMHRRRLAEALKKKRREPAPIAGELTPSGFVQKGGGRHLYLFWIMAGVLGLGFLWLLRRAFIGFGQPGWSWGSAVAIAIFGVIIGWLIYAFAIDRKGLAAELIRGELTVERWPLRTGEQCAVRYRASARGRRSIVKAQALLRCKESISWRNTTENRTDGRSLAVHSVRLGEAAPAAAADGSLTVTWKMQVPADAPPTLAGITTGIAWEIAVDVQADGPVAATHEFPVLVVPGTA